MIVRFPVLAAAALAIAFLVARGQPTCAQPPAAQLKIVNKFKIGGTGRWDYATVDRENGRLYVARDKHVQVIDLDKGMLIGDITGLKGAHGTAIVSSVNLGFVTCSGENAVAAFDLETLKIIRKITMPDDGGKGPSAILFDPTSQKVIAFCSGGDAVVVDPADLDTQPVSIPCGGKLEFGQADGKGHVYVNNQDQNEIVVIDSNSFEVTDRWPVAPVTAPSGLGIDIAHHRLFCVGANQQMAILDYSTGKVLGSAAIGKGVDDCVFDPILGVAVSANGADGTATVVRETAPGEFTVVQTLKTLKMGHTIAGDFTGSLFFIPGTVPAEGGDKAQFGVLVLGPAK